VRDVVDTVKKVTGRNIATVESPRRPGDPARLVASSQKMRHELGWIPRYPDLETIVKTAYDWHRKHPKGYDDENTA
jgi:UDP-glucose 4-epimerase